MGGLNRPVLQLAAYCPLNCRQGGLREVGLRFLRLVHRRDYTTIRDTPSKMPGMEPKPLDYATPGAKEPLLFPARLSLQVSVGCGPLAYALGCLACLVGARENDKAILAGVALVSIPAISLIICIVSLTQLVPKDNRRSRRFAWASLYITIGWIVALAGMCWLATELGPV